MFHPLQSGGFGGVEFLLALLIYLLISVFYLLFPLLVVSFLREERGRLDGPVRGRLRDLLRARRPDVLNPRDR